MDAHLRTLAGRAWGVIQDVICCILMFSALFMVALSWYDIMQGRTPWMFLAHVYPAVGVPCVLAHNLFFVIALVYLIRRVAVRRRRASWTLRAKAIAAVFALQLVNIMAVLLYLYLAG